MHNNHVYLDINQTNQTTSQQQSNCRLEERKQFLIIGIIMGICICIITSNVFLYSLLKTKNISAIYVLAFDIIGMLILSYPSFKNKDMHIIASCLFHLTTTVSIFIIRPIENETEEHNIDNCLIFKIIAMGFYVVGMAVFLMTVKHRNGLLIIHDNHNLEGNCCICLDVYANKVCVRTSCSHIFHMDCLQSWIAIHNTCPLCRCTLSWSS